jgi:hypothetical protein
VDSFVKPGERAMSSRLTIHSSHRHEVKGGRQERS